jgi:hypothetical protein
MTGEEIIEAAIRGLAEVAAEFAEPNSAVSGVASGGSEWRGASFPAASPKEPHTDI